jgi:hypothetical protein
MDAEHATDQVTTIVDRIIALRDQLTRADLPARERSEIAELIADWRLRLAVLLRASS